MTDLTKTIVAKSDQLNSDDLIGGPITVRITGVKVGGSAEQPIDISYEGDNGKPWKPCKSMRRVLVHIWGADGKAYVGRRMTLFRDPNVKWGGEPVGGIRISHLSHIDSPVTMPLTATRGSKKTFIVEPLTDDAPTAAPQTETAEKPLTPAQKAAKTIQSHIKRATDVEDLNSVWTDFKDDLDDIKAESQKAYDFLKVKFDERMKELEAAQ